jgi:hypothetical protein
MSSLKEKESYCDEHKHVTTLCMIALTYRCSVADVRNAKAVSEARQKGRLMKRHKWNRKMVEGNMRERET